jgi:hypothetical protein
MDAIIKVGKENGNDILKRIGGTLYWVRVVRDSTRRDQNCKSGGFIFNVAGPGQAGFRDRLQIKWYFA